MEKNLFLEKGFVKWTRLIDSEETNSIHLNGKQSTFSIEEFQNIIEYNPGQVMTRGEFSKLIDHLVNPFDKEIEISGDWKVN